MLRRNAATFSSTPSLEGVDCGADGGGLDMTTTELDTGKVEEFAGRMVELMNSSMLSLMTSVGHRTGLFDTMATLPPSTSSQIADGQDSMSGTCANG